MAYNREASKRIVWVSFTVLVLAVLYTVTYAPDRQMLHDIQDTVAYMPE